MALREVIDEYLGHVEISCSPATIRQYRSVLRGAFLPWARARKLNEVEEITQAVLDDWSRHLQKQPGAAGKVLSRTTVRTYIRNLNLLLAWAYGSGDLAVKLRAVAPRPKRPELQVLTREEMDAIAKAAHNPRDELIVRLLADTGMRVGELVNLRCRDLVSQNGNCFLHLRGKTDSRTVGIQRPLFRKLRKYITDGRPGGEDEDAPVFLSIRLGEVGGHWPLTPNGVGQLVRQLGREVGLKKRVYPHLFRHSYATDWLNKRGDEIMLAEVLGHGSLTMIKEVYSHLAADHVHDAMMAYLQTGKKPKGKPDAAAQ